MQGSGGRFFRLLKSDRVNVGQLIPVKANKTCLWINRVLPRNIYIDLEIRTGIYVADYLALCAKENFVAKGKNLPHDHDIHNEAC